MAANHPAGRPTLLFVGDFSASKVGNRSVAEDLVQRLAQTSYRVVTTSGQSWRPRRVADMVFTTWLQRTKVDAASIDVFSGRGFLWAEATSLILRAARVPFVLVLHGGALPTFAQRLPRRVGVLLGSADRVVTPSAYLADQMKAYVSTCQLIPNPVDLARYPFVVRETTNPKLLWLRSFHHIYNPTLAPRVLASLAETFPDITLTMIGPDRGDGSLAATRQLAQELGVAERIDFVGPVANAEVPKWLSSGDILINTTTADNTPVSVLEAMASGICVVSTAVGGIPYLLSDRKNALLVPSNDAVAMTKAVTEILTSPSLAEKLSTRGRALVETFDWSIVLPKWLKLFSELTKEKSQ